MASEQLRDRDPKRSGESLERAERDVPLAPLDGPDIGPVQPTLLRQPLLRESVTGAVCPDIVRQGLAQLRSGLPHRQLRPTSPTSDPTAADDGNLMILNRQTLSSSPSTSQSESSQSESRRPGEPEPW